MGKVEGNDEVWIFDNNLYVLFVFVCVIDLWINCVL